MAVETFDDNFIELEAEPVWPEKVRGYALGSWVQGGAGGVDNIPLEDLADRTEYLKQDLEERTETLKKEIKTIIGLSPGGFLDANDFGEDPTQQMLTDYALSKIGGTDPLKIWNGTRVKNLFDNNLWILVNTPDTDPAIFEWVNNGPEIIVTVDDFENAPFLVASDKRKVTIKGGTRIKLGDDVFYPQRDIELNVPDILDTGNIANGKDYYLHLIRGGANFDIKASLTKEAPAGLTANDANRFGGFHTLCADAGNGMKYFEGGVEKNHPLNGYIAADILPKSVYCLNFRPFSEPEGMVHISSLDFWSDIYLASMIQGIIKSVYQGAILRSRQYVDFVEDFFQVGKELLDDGEFAAAALGSNEQTAVSGSSEAGATNGGAGGRVDTANRRMISIYGCEEMCGSVWQWLRTTSAGGVDGSMSGQLTTTSTYGWIAPTQSAYGPYGQSGGKGSFYGLACALLAGGGWSDAAACGSRARDAGNARSNAGSILGGRGRSRTRR